MSLLITAFELVRFYLLNNINNTTKDFTTDYGPRTAVVGVSYIIADLQICSGVF